MSACPNPWREHVCVCVWVSQIEIKSCWRRVQNTGYIYWLAVRLTHLRVSEWSSEQLFKSRGCFLQFPMGVTAIWVRFTFVETNALTFVFKEIGSCFLSGWGSWDLSLDLLQLRFSNNLPEIIHWQTFVHCWVPMHSIKVCIFTLVCKCVCVHANCFLPCRVTHSSHTLS